MAHHHDDADDGTAGVVPVSGDRAPHQSYQTWWGMILGPIPWFTYVLLLYILGALWFNGPRAILFSVRGEMVTWGEVVVFIAGIVALMEVFKVSKPGVDNAIEVWLIVAFAAVQAVLIALSVAWPEWLWFMQTPENIMLFVLNGVQGFLAQRVNARSLVRTITTPGTVTG